MRWLLEARLIHDMNSPGFDISATDRKNRSLIGQELMNKMFQEYVNKRIEVVTDKRIFVVDVKKGKLKQCNPRSEEDTIYFNIINGNRIDSWCNKGFLFLVFGFLDKDLTQDRIFETRYVDIEIKEVKIYDDVPRKRRTEKKNARRS